MKKLVAVLSILVVIAVIIGSVIFKTRYVVLDLDKVYKKDIEYLCISNVDDDMLKKMQSFENLTTLDILYSDINGIRINKINQFTNLNDLMFLRSNIDFIGVENESLNIIRLAICNTVNIKELANCSFIAELNISKTTIDDKLVITDDTDILNKKYSLKDSSDFSYLDNIKKLNIYYTEIEDISGLMEMDSLQTFTVTKGYISEEYIKMLEGKGIIVIEDKDE